MDPCTCKSSSFLLLYYFIACNMFSFPASHIYIYMLFLGIRVCVLDTRYHVPYPVPCKEIMNFVKENDDPDLDYKLTFLFYLINKKLD